MDKEFLDWINKIYPLIFNKTLNRADTNFDFGQVIIYWAGTVIRIDIKPN